MPSQAVIDKARRLRAAGAVARSPRPDELYYIESESQPGLPHAVAIWRHRDRTLRKATCSCEYRGEISTSRHPVGDISVNRQCGHMLAVLASR